MAPQSSIRLLLSAAYVLAYSFCCEAKFLAANGHFAVRTSTMLSFEHAFETNGMGAGRDRRLEYVRSSIEATLLAMPRNAAGKFDTPVVIHTIRSFFAKEHGWQINGLQRSSPAGAQGTSLLFAKAPNLAESLSQGKPLLSREVEAAIVAIEGLVIQEVSQLLGKAYEIIRSVRSEMIGQDEMKVLLSMFLKLVWRGDTVKALPAADIPVTWKAVDAVANYDFAERNIVNPFVPRRYSFPVASVVASHLVHAFGRDLNNNCVLMKEQLMTLDPRGFGRVPLDVFHTVETWGPYSFVESAEYLDQIGALDKTGASVPQVRIANYLLGPGNCIARSSFYSVCCLSECEGLMADLEDLIKAPTASPDVLLTAVSNVSTAYDVPRQLSARLVEKLRAVGEIHDGMVPLHGRLFAQWLHFAFPHECAFPAKIDTEWYGKNAIKASQEERYKNYSSVVDSDLLSSPSALEQWTDEEALLFHTEDKDGSTWLRVAAGFFVQIAMFMAAIGASMRAVVMLPVWCSVHPGAKKSACKGNFV